MPLVLAEGEMLLHGQVGTELNHKKAALFDNHVYLLQIKELQSTAVLVGVDHTDKIKIVVEVPVNLL
jgi:hypothetical protein